MENNFDAKPRLEFIPGGAADVASASLWERELTRKDFLKAGGAGIFSLFLSGCGLASVGKNHSGANISTPAGGAANAAAPNTGNGMKIVVITGTAHAENISTSKFLATNFIRGAQDKGHSVFRFDAASEKINGCTGCDMCGMNGPCVQRDSIETKLMPQMLEADMLVLCTPLYYFGMSAQLKTCVDRFYSRTGQLHGKRSVLLATAWNNDSWTMTALTGHYKRLVEYMEWKDDGMVLAVGCGTRGSVERSDFPQLAYQIGNSL